jgi:hypothetical protein
LVIGRNHDWTTLSGSEWIGVADGESHSPDGGYIYEVHFSMPSFTQASISLTMTCDNWGKASLNGNFLGRCVDEPPPVFSRLFTFSSSDPTIFLPSENVLEFRVGNTPIGPGLINPSGLLFGAQIDYVVPEPSALLSLAMGLIGMAIGTRTRPG